MKNQSSIIDAIAIAIGGVIAVQLVPELNKIVQNRVLVLIISGAISVLVFYLLVFLFRILPQKIRVTRKIVDAKAKYEGVYFEIKNINGERSYAIVCLTFNRSANEYQLSGTSMESDGSIGIQWKSNFVKIDVKDHKIIYAQSGHLTDSSNGKTFDGVTYMNFEHFLKRSPTSGVGHFIDTIPAKSDFAFHRITVSECKELLGKKFLENRNDYMRFVQKYHELKDSKIFTWER